MPELAAWARWSPDALAPPWTVGVEEEVALVDARTGTIANRIDDVLAALPAELAAHASAETHACVVELKTSPHTTVTELTAELGALRPALAGVLREELGLRAAATGSAATRATWRQSSGCCAPSPSPTRRLAARDGLDGLVAGLVEGFLPARRPVAA